MTCNKDIYIYYILYDVIILPAPPADPGVGVGTGEVATSNSKKPQLVNNSNIVVSTHKV